jgi:hypothetical protein
LVNLAEVNATFITSVTSIDVNCGGVYNPSPGEIWLGKGKFGKVRLGLFGRLASFSSSLSVTTKPFFLSYF